MYNVKVNGNYNVLINDISVYVSTSHANGIDISKEKHDISKDLASLVKAGIVIVNPAGSKEAKAETKAVKVEAKQERAFVKEIPSNKEPKDVFVAQPKEELVEEKVEELKEEVKIEEPVLKAKEVEVVKETTKTEKAATKKAEKAVKKSTKNTTKGKK